MIWPHPTTENDAPVHQQLSLRKCFKQSLHHLTSRLSSSSLSLRTVRALSCFSSCCSSSTLVCSLLKASSPSSTVSLKKRSSFYHLLLKTGEKEVVKSQTSSKGAAPMVQRSTNHTTDCLVVTLILLHDLIRYCLSTHRCIIEIKSKFNESLESELSKDYKQIPNTFHPNDH